ncbi:LytTR family DNA-binding domain-containing protein [Lactobacillus sp. B4026]|uniref:LytTR family DNA-binding domain-containing protein n=1 Tax=Lactobacillus sp. B4026 TaxID=2818035 RepID=UPI00226B44EE|nr:LytTR family DNA-binding domain-containing protein [Lactobacillus sp. B4026]MCX8736966.1 LytTR family transcriptional regulator [Lactobacillus sp. B4026]
MKIKFQTDATLNKDEIEVAIKAMQETETVSRLISYLNKFNENQHALIPVKTEDRIVTLKQGEIIKIEVQTTTLIYYTTKNVFKAKGRLYQVLTNLNDDFVQVSRHGLINLNYLESIEVGFAGNMVAKLANNLKANVSRHYLPELEKKVGL